VPNSARHCGGYVRRGGGRSRRRDLQKARRKARRGQSGGYRLIVAYRAPGTDRILFVYAFAKNAASNLTPQGQEALSTAAAAFLAADHHQVAALSAAGDIKEVNCDGHERA
jgi:hypothetical protein